MAPSTEAASRPFRSAAPHYLAGRPPYPDRLVRRVARLAGLTAADRVLDLGCGPAMLAAAFAGFAREVIAMDPEPEMLRAGQAAFGQIANLHLVRGSSDDLSPELGVFRLVAMGRSFAWMDRPQTLRALDALIVPGGAIALFDSGHQDELPDNAWTVRYRALRHRHDPPDAANPRRNSDNWLCHEAILLDSAFSMLESAAVIERRRTGAAALVHRALSMSSSTPDRLGAAAAARLAGEIEALVQAVAPDGALAEVVTTTALIARRPGEADV